MQRKDITIRLKSSMEMRPAAMLVQIASRYRSDIRVDSGSRHMNAKSIMGMMSLGLERGDTVTITTNGDDEIEAMQEIEAYLERKKPAEKEA